MKFGKVAHPEQIDFTLPEDHPDTQGIWRRNAMTKTMSEIYIGCAKWNRQDLKNFYPRGTKNALEYYATQFNSIELNATFYRNFPHTQFEKWYHSVPETFKFFPKVHQHISHLKRLINIEEALEEFLNGVVHLREKLGTIFLQMHHNFTPKDFNRLENFLKQWPGELRLAVELRHTDWFNNLEVAERLYDLLEKHHVANSMVDTAGRRDLLHMRLTNSEAFIRFTGTNTECDYTRMDDWIERLKLWENNGLQRIHFFIHQSITKEATLLSSYFIKNINTTLGSHLKVPQALNDIGYLLF